MQKFFQGGGGKLGVWTKRGGESLCEVLYPTLARGGRMTQGGGKCPSPPPLITALVYMCLFNGPIANQHRIAMPTAKSKIWTN